MQHQKVLRKVECAVRRALGGEGTGHDFYHIDRVRRNALVIAHAERADAFVVELGALLHDIADHKFHGGDERVGPERARALLIGAGADTATTEAVVHIVENVSYSRSVGGANRMRSLEGKIVQDADRLDSMGAIGVARAFAYGGSRGQMLYDPKGTTRTGIPRAAYKRGRAASTIHHFYEKLLLLKDGMNTKTGKRLAERRHRFLERFLKEFLEEWAS